MYLKLKLYFVFISVYIWTGERQNVLCAIW